VTPSDAGGVLRGCNVLDLSGGASAAIAGWLLAEAGANVVTVGGITHSEQDAGRRTWDRGKRSLALDLDSDADRQLADRLLAGADVLITDLDQEAARARGLDEAALRERFPQLIIASITWYPEGHERGGTDGEEILVQASTGLMGEVLSSSRRPTFIRFPITTWGAGLLAAAGIMAQLYQRERYGTAGVVRTSHVQGALYFLSNVWTEAEHAAAELQTKFGVLNRPHPWIFECGDGRWIQVNVGFVNVPLVIEVLAEMGFEQPELTVDTIEEVSRFYIPMFRQRPSADWLAALHELDIDCERLLHVGELYDDELVVASGYTVEVADATLGVIRQASVPLEMDPPLQARGAAPQRGEHSAQIRESGWGADSRLLHRHRAGTRPTRPEPPLAGLRVVDFGMNLSAPVCAKLLGDLGASVIKLERCDGGDRLRSVHVQFAGGNRGKRSIGLDLSRAETRPLVERLISESDVVVNNLRPDKSQKLGIDYESLARINPALVYAQVSGYGYSGPAAPWPARDPAVGAWSGWTLDGGSESVGPIWLRLLIGDTGAALLSLYGVLLTLLKRELDGGGGRVRSSLLGTAAMYASVTYSAAPSGQFVPIPATLPDVTGISAGYRIYPAADGWVAVAAAGPDGLDRLRSATGATGAADASDAGDAGDAASLESATSALKAADLVAALRAAGVPAEIVRTGLEREFLAAQANVDAGLVAEYRHPRHGVMRQPGQYWDMGHGRLWNGMPPPVFGEHTAEILTELGCPPDRQDALRALGLVAGAAS
jgi:crotonobetainyl-CoA:carnitine CoA-transferase CaiB-like acyl-CoA transferase